MSNIKRFWWISALYFIGLIILYPLRFLQTTSDRTDYSILIESTKFHGYFLLIIPIFIGVLMFQYIHKSKAVAMFNSLPISRTALFLNQTISGLLIMLPPVILNGVVLIILRSTTQNMVYFCNINDILITTALIVIVELLVYSSTIFVGMLTGTAVSHFIFSYAFYFIPYAIYAAITSFLSYMLTGFVANMDFTLTNNILLNLPPITGL